MKHQRMIHTPNPERDLEGENENCPKLDECYKIKMILDKDLLDSQYAEAIRAVCANCSELKDGGGYGYETQN